MQITREYKINTDYDVIVCGGGPAGVAAAISSARHGAKTLLIEQGGCLGGLWTRGLLTWLIDTNLQEGLLREVLETLKREADGLDLPHISRFTADTEKTKLIFERLCLDAGVDILYHTFISDAVTSERKLEYVLTESKSGHVAYKSKIYVDTTGDGDVGFHAGAAYSFGDVDGSSQPLSLIAQISGIDVDDFLSYDSRRVDNKSAKKALLSDLEDIGISPSYKYPLLALLSEENNRYCLMINHEYMHGMSAENLTQGTLEARKEINDIIDALRAKGGIWKNVHITSTADMIGVRDGRRIKGLYELTGEDVRSGESFDDAICTVRFNTDVHSPKAEDGAIGAKKYGSKHPPYQIPLRSLISADIDNLLMGGRTISGDFIAHSSYRVAGPAFRTGEVSGLCAAYCVKKSILPKDINSAKDVLGDF